MCPANGGKLSATRVYLLAGLVRCRLCGRRMDAYWVNNRAGYRCRHGHTSAQRATFDRAKNLYVREDEILASLPAHLAVLELELDDGLGLDERGSGDSGQRRDLAELMPQVDQSCVTPQDGPWRRHLQRRMSIDESLNPDGNVKIVHGVMMCPRNLPDSGRFLMSPEYQRGAAGRDSQALLCRVDDGRWLRGAILMRGPGVELAGHDGSGDAVPRSGALFR